MEGGCFPPCLNQHRFVMQYNQIIKRVNVVDLKVYLIRELYVRWGGSVCIISEDGTKSVFYFWESPVRFLRGGTGTTEAKY